MSYLLTSESVTSGHPDKLCDFISDSILDECLTTDKDARVAIEVFTKGLSATGEKSQRSVIVIGGEVTLSNSKEIDYEEIARKSAIKVGYTSQDFGMDAQNKDTCEIIVLVGRQSRDISQGVNIGEGLDEHQGAGDQGIMYGYATNESERFPAISGTYMPIPILLAHRITTALTELREQGNLSWARPDGKSQVTIAYDDNGIPTHVHSIIIAIQHEDLANNLFDGDLKKERDFINREIEEKIINKIIPVELLDDSIRVIVNGTGRFVKGGPEGDAGLTGRKIIVDSYGGIGRHGGGCFSGKDPSKVDRSGAYAARWAAKHIVASGLSDICEIQLSYAIGISKPISINVETFGKSKFDNNKIKKIVEKIFDFRPSVIIDTLNLKDINYCKTSAGGHFGRNEFPWEEIDDNLTKKLIHLAEMKI